MTKHSHVTIRDVAQRAGVSIATVSYVLNNSNSVGDETRNRVLKAAAELGYRPNVLARNLRAQESRTLGYGWRRYPADRWPPILDRFLYAMAEAAEAEGYHILTFTASYGKDAWETYDELMRTGQVDGFIITDTDRNDPRVRYLLDSGFPFAVFGRANEAWDFPYVDVDGEAGIYQATRHLLELGHRRVGFLAWPSGSLAGYYRRRGYQHAMAEANVAPHPAWLIRTENDEAMARDATHRLLALPEDERPTAIVAISDLIALGVMNALYEVGLRPGQDVAVVGFDDIPTAQYFHPSLSSVRQPIPKVGERLVKMLLHIIREEPLDGRHILLKPELIVRESSGPAVS